MPANGVGRVRGRGRNRRYHGAITHVDTALREACDERGRLEARLTKRRRELVAERRRLGPVRRAQDSLVWSRKRVLRRTEQLVTSYREAHAAYGAAAARVDALEGAQQRLRADLARYEGQWLTRVESALDSAGGGAAPFSGVVIADPDVIYGDLLAAIDRTPAERGGAGEGERMVELEVALLRGVASVTMEGLRAMLGTSAEVGAIAAALEDPGFAWKAPLWGGETVHAAPRHRFLVLPPLAAEDFAGVSRVVSARLPGVRVVMSDTVAVAASVVALAV